MIFKMSTSLLTNNCGSKLLFTHSHCIPVLVLLFFELTFSSARVISSANIETLKIAHVIFRHGSRSPLTSYNKDPYNNTVYWPDGLGQLTAKGKQQEYELGQYLRWRYMKFIDSKYCPAEIYAQSSDIDRAIMSGELVLAGLYPLDHENAKSVWNQEINWQPIPVHTIPAAEDNKIVFGAKCPRYEKLFYDYLKSPAMAEIDKENEYMYKYLTEYSRNNVSNILAASDLYDVLYIQELHNLPLPDWAPRYYPTRLKQATELLWDSIVPTTDMKRLRGGPILGEFMSNIDKVTRKSKREAGSHPKAKLFLYSGHDSTLATILGSLGVFERQIIPYSAAVMFELHQERATSDSPGEYFIEVFFRNDTTTAPYSMKIPNCGEPCKLDQFERLMQNIVIKDWGVWHQQCHSSSLFSSAAADAFFSGIDTFAMLMFGITFAIGFSLATVVFAVVVLPMSRRKMLIMLQAEKYGSHCTAGASSSKIPSRLSITNNNYKDYQA